MQTFPLKELYKLPKETITKLDVEGIYFIFNHNKKKYYIGQSKNIYKRSMVHFQENRGSHKVFKDYMKGEKFEITFVPLNATPYNTVSELEDIAIISYDSIINGYNDGSGYRNDRPFFENEDYKKVSNLIINKVKDTKFFETVTNIKKRSNYIHAIFKRFNLKMDYIFIEEFKKQIQIFHRDYFR